MRILLVDDSPDNRWLIRAHLKGEGHEWVEAENGELALLAFVPGRFDLVLMDMTMPIMDGYAATRAIRAAERASPEVRRTWVVAFTAYESAEDVLRCQESGCDSYLAKPVQKSALLRVLCEPFAERMKETQASPSATVALDAAIQALQPSFLANRVSEQAAIDGALAANDAETLQRLGHNLRGTGASYGFPRLSVIGAALERAAIAGDWASLRALGLELRAELTRAGRALRKGA